jgi:hypothetical protein
MKRHKVLYGSGFDKHTPGPWFIVGDYIHDRQTFFDESGARIGETPNSICEMHAVPFGKKDANIRLIAHAPDMYEALVVIAGMQVQDSTDFKELANLCISMAKLELSRIGGIP